jgi:prepilin-type N-terminal cleavage/methylation domain-containing protein
MIRPNAFTRRAKPWRTGFSLAEVVIALSLFGVMASGFIGATMFTRRSAESAVCENAALNLAESYMEQIKTFTFATLKASINNSAVAIPTMSSQTGADSIYQNAYTIKNIAMRRNSVGATVQTLKVEVKAVLSDASGGTTKEIIGIVIYYRWTDPTTSQLVTKAIRSAKANL